MIRMFCHVNDEILYDIRGESYEKIQTFINNNFNTMGGKHYGVPTEKFHSKGSKYFVLVEYKDDTEDVMEVETRDVSIVIQEYKDNKEVEYVSYMGTPNILNI